MSRYEALVIDFGGVMTTSLENAMAAFAIANAVSYTHLTLPTTPYV